MLTSILFYNFVIFFSLCIIYFSLHVGRVSYVKYIAFFILFFISSVRYGIGTDYDNYKKIFDLIHIDELDVNIEPLYYLINIIAIKLGLEFEYVIAISSLLVIYPLVKCSNEKFSFWIIFYFLTTFYLASFNAIRQGIAISISCYALYRLVFFEDKKRYFLFILIASLFHYSALVGIFAFYFRKIAFPFWFNVFFLILISQVISKFVPLFLSSDIFMATKYGVYAKSDFIDGAKLGSGMGFILQLLPYIIIILFSKFIFDESAKRNLAVNVSLLLVIVKILTLHIGIFSRLEYSFVFILAIVFGEVAKQYKRSYLNFGLFLYMLLWNILQFELMLINGTHEILPYQTLFGSLQD